LSIPLGFLGQGTYMAEVYEDASDAARNPKDVSIRQQNVQRSDTIVLHLASGGGCAIRFVPAKRSATN
jgi:alpha-glucosidase